MPPEEFTDDRLLLIELKNELRSAHNKIELQKELLQYKDEEMRKKDIRIDRFLDIMEKGIQSPVSVNVTAGNTTGITGSSVGVVGDHADIAGGINHTQADNAQGLIQANEVGQVSQNFKE
jgi:hypothetical protein